MEKTGENIRTIVVPKNTGLKGYAWKALKEAGLDLEQAEEVEDGKLKLNFTIDKKTGVKITGMLGKRGALEGA